MELTTHTAAKESTHSTDRPRAKPAMRTPAAPMRAPTATSRGVSSRFLSHAHHLPPELMVDSMHLSPSTGLPARKSRLGTGVVTTGSGTYPHRVP